MTQADRIRQFALDHYIAPARLEGRDEVVIRAGDVHPALSLTSAMPAVCSAIGSGKFYELARVTLRERVGPTNGANVYFHFALGAHLLLAKSTVHSREPAPRRVLERAGSDVDLTGAIVLVSCVKSKLPHAATARALYTSAWFRKVRAIVEASSARWFVLSSLYGLVAPDTVIEPYDYTLNTLGVAVRRAWATKVLDSLLPETVGQRRVVMFAGDRCREFLVWPLRRRGLEVEVPMANLTRGEQLAWLSGNE